MNLKGLVSVAVISIILSGCTNNEPPDDIVSEYIDAAINGNLNKIEEVSSEYHKISVRSQVISCIGSHIKEYPDFIQELRTAVSNIHKVREKNIAKQKFYTDVLDAGDEELVRECTKYSFYERSPITDYEILETKVSKINDKEVIEILVKTIYKDNNTKWFKFSLIKDPEYGWKINHILLKMRTNFNQFNM